MVGVPSAENNSRTLPTSHIQGGMVLRNLPGNLTPLTLQPATPPCPPPLLLFAYLSLFYITETLNIEKSLKNAMRWRGKQFTNKNNAISGCIVGSRLFSQPQPLTREFPNLSIAFCCRSRDQPAPDLKCMAKFKTLVRANL